MRKLVFLAMVLAIVLVATAPSIAQVASQGFEEEDIESGEASPSVGVSNEGDQVNLCPAAEQSAQSGNVQNEQGVVQYASESDDIEAEGSSIETSASLDAECDQLYFVPPPPPPDLLPSAFCKWAIKYPEEVVIRSIVVTVMNEGGTPARGFESTLTFEPNPPTGFPGEMPRLLRPRVSSLGVGQFFEYMEADVPMGAEPFTVTVDSNGEVEESDEVNNTRSFVFPATGGECEDR